MADCTCRDCLIDCTCRGGTTYRKSNLIASEREWPRDRDHISPFVDDNSLRTGAAMLTCVMDQHKRYNLFRDNLLVWLPQYEQFHANDRITWAANVIIEPDHRWGHVLKDSYCLNFIHDVDMLVGVRLATKFDESSWASMTPLARGSAQKKIVDLWSDNIMCPQPLSRHPAWRPERFTLHNCLDGCPYDEELPGSAHGFQTIYSCCCVDKDVDLLVVQSQYKSPQLRNILSGMGHGYQCGRAGECVSY